MGHIATYNEGIAWASADYMVLLSADDYLLPDAISRAAELMDRHPSVGFTFGRAIPLDHDQGARPSIPSSPIVRSRILSGIDFIKLSGAKNIVLAPTVMVRTALQKQVGGYVPELTHSGDMEMWLRFAAHGSVGFLDVDQAVYRRHSTNMSRGYSPEDDLCQRQAAFECFFNTCEKVLEEASALRRWLSWLLACDAVKCASRAFNEDNLELSRRLLAFAKKLDPGVERSLPWLLLTCKRCLGVRTWLRLKPIVDFARHFSSLRREPNIISTTLFFRNQRSTRNHSTKYGLLLVGPFGNTHHTDEPVASRAWKK